MAHEINTNKPVATSGKPWHGDDTVVRQQSIADQMRAAVGDAKMDVEQVRTIARNGVQDHVVMTPAERLDGGLTNEYKPFEIIQGNDYINVARHDGVIYGYVKCELHRFGAHWRVYVNDTSSGFPKYEREPHAFGNRHEAFGKLMSIVLKTMEQDVHACK